MHLTFAYSNELIRPAAISVAQLKRFIPEDFEHCEKHACIRLGENKMWNERYFNKNTSVVEITGMILATGSPTSVEGNDLIRIALWGYIILYQHRFF